MYLIYRILPLVGLVVFWQLLVILEPRYIFFFGSPKEIATLLIQEIANLAIFYDIALTGFQSLLGLVMGTIIGTLIGVSFWFSKTVQEISRPYVIALGSAPILAFTPIILVWFGTGFLSKVMIVFFATLFVALSQAYSGAIEADQKYSLLMQSFGAQKKQTFKLVILPGALNWIVAGIRINVGIALLGSFIGEYISSTRGLGHMILVAGGLFQMSRVMMGVFLFVALGLLLNWFITKSSQSLLKKYYEK